MRQAERRKPSEPPAGGSSGRPASLGSAASLTGGLRTMSPRHLRGLAVVCLLTIIAGLLLNASSRSSHGNHESKSTLGVKTGGSRGKVDRAAGLPGVAARALIYFATSRKPLDKTMEEISITLDILQQRGPSNVLAFGLAQDSPLWAALNAGGRTVFLEDSLDWMAATNLKVMKAGINLEMYHIAYKTILSQAHELMTYAKAARTGVCKPHQDLESSECNLTLTQLPRQLFHVDWDVIIIDAPVGWRHSAPGRMAPIFTAAVFAHNRQSPGATDVLVHDITRKVEQDWSDEFLCLENKVACSGRLCHYRIPEDDHLGTQFCQAKKDKPQTTLIERST